KKLAKLITFTTTSGRKIEVTHNHKMFSYLPNKSDNESSSAAVNRGNKVRIKINIEMCYRHYRSKGDHKLFLKNPLVSHLLMIETSHQPTISKLKKMGFEMTKAKVGCRLRLSNIDLTYLGKIAKDIHSEIGGIIDTQIRVGKTNQTHKRALVIPAKNILPGMFLPVVVSNQIVYEQIIKKTEVEKNLMVYDLEVNRTHNFVADNIVVHNSVYKFRGASISNILQFKDDYPQAKEIILTENYRSNQEILDKAYHFIQNNNPNRLEAKLKINKKLVAKRTPEPSLSPRVKFFNFNGDHESASFVVEKIKSEYQAKADVSWMDFAILVRANDTADKYIKELKRQGLPYQFVSLKGLYFKPIILDIISYFKLLDNYHESAALFRVLNMDVFKVAYEDLVNINKTSRTKVWSLYEGLKNVSMIDNITPESINNINHLLTFIEAHSELAKNEKPSRLFVKFVYDIGLLKTLDHDEDREIFSFLNQFYQKIKEFETADPDLRLKDFIEMIDLEMEAGETGSLRLDYDDADVIKVMTVHAAKGLEFKYVFIVDLVDKRFPTINRGERISIPEAMIKEKLGEGSDFHLEEERRLFYVAATRAKDELYLIAAKDYGGAKPKKPSRFISEMGIDPELSDQSSLVVSDLERDIASLNNISLEEKQVLLPQLPAKFSFSQLAAYSSCPLQYKLAFILRIPAPTDKPSLIFGQTMHSVLREFMLPLLVGEEKESDLSESKIMELYDKYWTGDGYENKESQSKYLEQGRIILQKFVQNLNPDNLPQISFLEKDFVLKIGGESIKGAIDRVDKLPDGTLEIIDYKTGNPKSKLEWKDKRQLILYQLFLEDYLKIKVSALSYYYLTSGEKISFVSKPKEVEKLQLEVIQEIKAIQSLDFTPTPDSLKCQFCDFKGICEFKK
ncbi:MAG: 3'-5' exonuclease, partial [Patescibacteria group bacterium]